MIVYFLTIITFVGIYLSAKLMNYEKGGYTTTLVLITLNGFISISVYSICYEYVVELTPGIGESITGGFINNIANVLGFL